MDGIIRKVCLAQYQDLRCLCRQYKIV